MPFCRANGRPASIEEERWHNAMRFLLDHVPDTIIVTLLIARTDGSARVVTCDCCENCAAEMVLGAASEVEEPDGSERPRFSAEAVDGPHYDA